MTNLFVNNIDQRFIVSKKQNTLILNSTSPEMQTKDNGIKFKKCYVAMTPAHGPFTITPMPAKNCPKAYGTRCICIQFKMVRISPINREKKGTTIKTRQKLLPDFKIFFNFSSLPDKEMRMTNTYCQINVTTQKCTARNNYCTGKVQ